jgi:hypothetical protein
MRTFIREGELAVMHISLDITIRHGDTELEVEKLAIRTLRGKLAEVQRDIYHVGIPRSFEDGDGV